jgi:hypothetical protein
MDREQIVTAVALYLAGVAVAQPLERLTRCHIAGLAEFYRGRFGDDPDFHFYLTNDLRIRADLFRPEAEDLVRRHFPELEPGTASCGPGNTT